VTAQGDRQEAIYENDTDRETFISLSPLQALRHQVLLGDEHFVEEIQSLTDGEKELSEYEESSAN